MFGSFMNESEGLLRFLDTGLNRETHLLHPFDGQVNTEYGD